ncbi:30S ribosomal protein S11 [Patescibacteria group bacterium]
MKKGRSKVNLRQRKKIKRTTATSGKVYIQSSFNNTIISVTDKAGNTICWGSSGTLGFKGSRKNTPYAAGVVSRNIIAKSEEIGIREVDVYVKGVGSGRDQAVRAFNSSNLEVKSLHDITPITHNGCRAKKARRV